ncbi:MAG: exodeoxyribonuclease III [Enterobacterales bacterium]|nr:exodeoxyribonuclease III [Enterobacterales bacterium]
MRLISFNVNGIRAREHQLQALKDDFDPDVIGIQESKVQDLEFPIEMVNGVGFEADFFGQKGHYGVCLLGKKSPLIVEKGFPTDSDDAQRRMIIGHYPMTDGRTLKVLNGYFPQGENRDHPIKFPAKRQFYIDLMTYLEEHCNATDPIVVMGDFNIAPEDTDIGIGEQNAKRWLREGSTSFLPEEREWYSKLMDWGLTDTYRKLYPDSDELYSWFNYRTRAFDREPKRGLRIDQILCTEPLVAHITGAGISYEVRGMTKPSDHCPIWVDFDLELA